MSTETTLYRKYRPGRWKDVAGQDHVISVLEGALEQGRVAHAYLFSGPRGTGKTSVARLLAKALKCEPEDLFEIDGASNRGIDEIRELRDAVRTLPFKSPVKVYIIDEVHMLTKEAFNALLKTLEEPPAYVYFILATTEPHKVPETIISRCQTFGFKRPTAETLKDVIARIAKAEGFKIDTASLDLLAFLGEGSFRDTIGMVQKAMSAAAAAAISIADVERVTNAPSFWFVEEILEAVFEREPGRGLAAVRRAGEENKDMKLLVRLILRALRFVMLFKFAPDLETALQAELAPKEEAWVAATAKRPTTEPLSTYLKRFLESFDDLRYAAVPELPLELAILDLCGGTPALPLQ